MKNASPRATVRRLPEGPSASAAAASAAGAIELTGDRLVIRLPDFRLLQLIARSVLLTAAILTFPWLRVVVLSAGSPPPAAAARSRWVDDPFHLPMLLRDLQRQGLLGTRARAVFLGDPRSRLPFLKQNKIEPVSSEREWMIPDRSVEFVLASGGFGDTSFEFIDRVLIVGGITAVRLSSDPSHSFHLPPNYRMVYIRRFGSTIVAMKKIANAGNNDGNAANLQPSGAGRRLLAVSTVESERFWKGAKYLPDLLGGSLAECATAVSDLETIRMEGEGFDGRTIGLVEGEERGGLTGSVSGLHGRLGGEGQIEDVSSVGGVGSGGLIRA